MSWKKTLSKMKLYELNSVYIINLFIFTIYLKLNTMKTVLSSTLVLIGVLIATSANAQNDPTLPTQLEEMKKMHVMVGNWKGEGWMQQGQSERKTFTVNESVQIKNNGATLLVEGRGVDSNSEATVHDAMAVVYFDAHANEYKFDTHLAKGMHKLAVGQMNENVFTWGFDLQNAAKIKYTLTFTDNTWNEVGEYSPDNTNWYKFLEMNLTKIEE